MLFHVVCKLGTKNPKELTACKFRAKESSYSILKIEVKVKFSLEQTMKTQRGSRGISLLFLQPRR
jgi:hypothetical protein